MFARTKRLLLRPGWGEDAARLHAAWSDDAIRRGLIDTPASRSVADADAFLTQDRDPLHPYFLIFARTGAAPRLVGGCGLHRLGADDRAETLLDFWIMRPFWGLGFATEAAGAALRIARATGRRPAIARAAPDNSAALHVLGKLGFAPDDARLPAPPRRPDAAGCALFRDSGSQPELGDSALEVYRDRPSMAA